MDVSQGNGLGEYWLIGCFVHQIPSCSYMCLALCSCKIHQLACLRLEKKKTESCKHTMAKDASLVCSMDLFQHESCKILLL